MLQQHTRIRNELETMSHPQILFSRPGTFLKVGEILYLGPFAKVWAHSGVIFWQQLIPVADP